MIGIVAAFAVAAACAVACNKIAKSRSGRHIFWGSMGFLFGPLAIPFAFLARPVASGDEITHN